MIYDTRSVTWLTMAVVITTTNSFMFNTEGTVAPLITFVLGLVYLLVHSAFFLYNLRIPLIPPDIESGVREE